MVSRFKYFTQDKYIFNEELEQDDIEYKCDSLKTVKYRFCPNLDALDK